MSELTQFQPNDCVMVDARILGPHQYVFVAHSESALKNQTYRCSVVAYGNGVWMHLAEWPWQAVGIETTLYNGHRHFHVLGRDGQFGTVGPSGAVETRLDPKRPVGPFRGVKAIGQRMFAFGMKREVFVADDPSRWMRLMEGIEPIAPTKKLTISEQMKMRLGNVGGINALALDEQSRLVAVGMRGEIWTLVNNVWCKVDSPTNLMLRDITAGPGGVFFACGQAGTLLKGTVTAWQPVGYKGPQRLDLNSICFFKGLLYIADGHALWALHGDDLSAVDHGVEEIVPCECVATNGDWLLSVAGQEVWETFDGQNWQCILG